MSLSHSFIHPHVTDKREEQSYVHIVRHSIKFKIYFMNKTHGKLSMAIKNGLGDFLSVKKG